MIKLINGRGQLGTALKDLIDKEKPNLEATIYHTWNFLEKSESIQKECFEKFKYYVNDNPREKIVFISTYSQADNFYKHYKHLSEDYLLENQEQGSVIRLPNLIGKGTCEFFREGKLTPFGEMELMTLSDAAKEVLDFAENSTTRVYTIKREIVSAKLVKDLILFGMDGK